MHRKRRLKLITGATAAVLLTAALWGAGKMVSAPTGEEAARLAAAEFLGVEPTELRLRTSAFAESRYDFILERDGSRVATVSVGRDPIFVRSGRFYGPSYQAGEPQLDRAAALKVARRFAAERLAGFRNLGLPADVKPGRAGEATTWELTWNAYKKGSGWRFLTLAVNSANGEVAWFVARKAQGRLLEPTVTREQAIADARKWWSTLRPNCSDVITNVEASILRASAMRPDGYPVWIVTGRSTGADGLVAGVDCVVDGITGEVVRPGQLPNPTVTRERAIAAATQYWQEGAPPGGGSVTHVEARMVRRSDVRPPGYPVWDVSGVRPGPEGATTRVRCLIDAVTGERIEPDSRGRELRPEPRDESGPPPPTENAEPD